MYYHCRPLKYVTYGKVFPYKGEDSWLMPCYKWLGNYCGYAPQIWLSRSTSDITGFRVFNALKKRKSVISKRSETKIRNDSVLFGFENIKGFPVDYDFWCSLLNDLMNIKATNIEEVNKALIKRLDQSVVWAKKEDYFDEDEFSKGWDETRDLDVFLKKYLFIEKDQVVVPALNLKSAKKIICRDERQKKKLRKMGFIEDRIHIKNLKAWSF